MNEQLHVGMVIYPPVKLIHSVPPKYEYIEPYITKGKKNDYVLRVVPSNYTDKYTMSPRMHVQKARGVVSFCSGRPPIVGECVEVLSVCEKFIFVKVMHYQPLPNELYNAYKNPLECTRWKYGVVEQNYDNGYERCFKCYHLKLDDYGQKHYYCSSILCGAGLVSNFLDKEEHTKFLAIKNAREILGSSWRG
jgi:hypothetical protein